ncbi:MAG: hypothetical protein V1859_11335 [archaeon]
MDKKFSFLKEVKDRLRPDDNVINISNSFCQKINKNLKKLKIKAICAPGGSVAKSTFIKDDYDIDIFAKFDYSYKDKEISSLLKKALSGMKGLEMLHGSRNYFQVITDSFTFEIVPVLDISDPKKAMNVTDMSPLHVEWAKKRLKKETADEIRLTKAFFKSIGVYGAESYINGFSGHVTDILIIYYGSFIEFLKKAKLWKPKVIIDISGYYKKKDVFFELNKSKTLGPLIVIDPILPNRNAAAALSLEKLLLFQEKAELFLQKPSPDFFIKKKITLGLLKKEAGINTLIIFNATTNIGKTDVQGCNALKSYEHILLSFKRYGFSVINSGWEWDKTKEAIIWLIIKNEKLSNTIVIDGPPIELKEHCLSFKKKYKNAFLKKGKLYAKVKREYAKSLLLARALVKDNYLKTKLLSIRLIETFK